MCARRAFRDPRRGTTGDYRLHRLLQYRASALVIGKCTAGRIRTALARRSKTTHGNNRAMSSSTLSTGAPGALTKNREATSVWTNRAYRYRDRVDNKKNRYPHLCTVGPHSGEKRSLVKLTMLTHFACPNRFLIKSLRTGTMLRASWCPLKGDRFSLNLSGYSHRLQYTSGDVWDGESDY